MTTYRDRVWRSALDTFIIRMNDYDRNHHTYYGYYLNDLRDKPFQEVAEIMRMCFIDATHAIDYMESIEDKR